MSELSIKKWGPAAWRFLHTISFTYSNSPTEEEKKTMYYFLHFFSKVIPCTKCRTDFESYINETLTLGSKHLNTKETLIAYINDSHNYVNRKIGKREYTLDESKNKYLKMEDYTVQKYLITLLLNA